MNRVVDLGHRVSEDRIRSILRALGVAVDHRKQQLEAYSGLFSLPELTTFASGSFRYEPTEATVTRPVYPFLTRLGQMTHGPIPAVYVVDLSPADRLHLHFLLAGVDHLPVSLIQKAWKEGNMKLERPIEGGAPQYLAEKVVRYEAEWDILPMNFLRAIRRVRYLERKRKREGIRLYDYGGRSLN